MKLIFLQTKNISKNNIEINSFGKKSWFSFLSYFKGYRRDEVTLESTYTDVTRK